MIPYAYLSNANTGVNIGNKVRQIDIYMKNCCVACLSARCHNDADTDVVLVTNIEVPAKYKDILITQGIKIMRQDFDMFNFDGSYTWALAFYKLCALYHMAHNSKYRYIAYLDSDVYVQNDFKDIWEECDNHILLYDINHGLQVAHYRHILSEMQAFESQWRRPTHYGGEFFAANRTDAKTFADLCIDIYTQMRKRNFVTTHGDEFITSLAAKQMIGRIKNAGAYVFRFWTGSFRLVSTCYKYNPVFVLHVPAEKERGMIKLFDKYIQKGKCPSKSKVYRLLHLSHRSPKIIIIQLIYTIKTKYENQTRLFGRKICG